MNKRSYEQREEMWEDWPKRIGIYGIGKKSLMDEERFDFFYPFNFDLFSPFSFRFS